MHGLSLNIFHLAANMFYKLHVMLIIRWYAAICVNIQPNDLQCILISQTMLFSVNQHSLLHCDVMLKHTNLLTCLVSTCQMYELAGQCRLRNFMKVGITR